MALLKEKLCHISLFIEIKLLNLPKYHISKKIAPSIQLKLETTQCSINYFHIVYTQVPRTVSTFQCALSSFSSQMDGEWL